MKRSVVTLIINNSNQILLLKRPPDHDKFPGQWCLPGGKIDWIVEQVQFEAIQGKNTLSARWETPEEAAYRETIEETGIKAIIFRNTNVVMSDGDFIVYVFSALKCNNYEVTKQFPNREHVEYKWVTPDNLPSPIGPMTYGLLNDENIFSECLDF